KGKSITLKAKKESSDDETSTSKSDDEEYAMAVRNFEKFYEERIDLFDNHERRINHSGKGMIRKARVIGNVLDAVIRNISLANVQTSTEQGKKKPLSRVLGVIAQMKPSKKSTKKLVSWLNRQMRYA
ncbi:hypothetical protein Tco_1257653, partial [Tanacetum coccineum]